MNSEVIPLGVFICIQVISQPQLVFIVVTMDYKKVANKLLNNNDDRTTVIIFIEQNNDLPKFARHFSLEITSSVRVKK